MSIEVELPNGVIAEFPDGMSNADIESVLAKQFGGQAGGVSSSEQVNEGDIPIMDDSGNLVPYAEPVRNESNPSFTERLKGGAETAAAMITGTTTGALGQGIGTIEGIVKEVAGGDFGSPEAANRIEDLAMKRSSQATFEPKTEEGQKYIAAIGETLAPLEALGPMAQQIQGATVGARLPQIKLYTKRLNDSSMPSIMKSEAGFRKHDLSAGAAQTQKQLERATTAEGLPIPLSGESALTKGQATRNFEQLQFEKETAKLAELGLPLRERVSNQAAILTQNLDALADQPSALRTELRDIGQSVDSALINRARSLKERERALFAKARDAGQLRENVSIDDFPIDSLKEMEDVAKNAVAIQRVAEKRGFINNDGTVNPKSLDEIESFRQFVNSTTDLTDPRESRVRRIVLNSIDDATENAGGDIYQRARKFSSDIRREFENAGITKRLTASKRGTNERQIAYEDVFKKVFLDSPVEEVNKIRGTLLKSGAEGKQAWADLKAKGIDFIKESAQNFNQLDEFGVPTLSPAKLNKVIKSLDEKGKLDGIYGKRNAQIIRDIGELSNDVFTAPPGAVNFSNTASALQVALDSLGTFAVTGIPAPTATALREATRFVKNAKKRTQIRDSLNFLSKQQDKK